MDVASKGILSSIGKARNKQPNILTTDCLLDGGTSGGH